MVHSLCERALFSFSFGAVSLPFLPSTKPVMPQIFSINSFALYKIVDEYSMRLPKYGYGKISFTEFRCDRTSPSDAERCGSLIEVAIEEIDSLVFVGLRLSECEIVGAISIPVSVVSNLNEHFSLRKLSTIGHKPNRVLYSWTKQIFTSSHRRLTLT